MSLHTNTRVASIDPFSFSSSPSVRMPAAISTLRRVQYAHGYLELGLIKEARAELCAIARPERSSIQVTEAWMMLHAEAQEWELAAAAAEKVTAAKPKDPQGWISWAFATRRFRSIGEAEAILLKAEQHLGATCGLIHYNLACYRCQVADFEGAKRRLAKACALEPHWKAAALQDVDLQPLWPEIAADLGRANRPR